MHFELAALIHLCPEGWSVAHEMCALSLSHFLNMLFTKKYCDQGKFLVEVDLLQILPSSNAYHLMHPLHKYNPAKTMPKA